MGKKWKNIKIFFILFEKSVEMKSQFLGQTRIHKFIYKNEV